MRLFLILRITQHTNGLLSMDQMILSQGSLSKTEEDKSITRPLIAPLEEIVITLLLLNITSHLRRKQSKVNLMQLGLILSIFLPARALQVNETGVGTVTMPPLFYSNTMETDGTVNYNEWSQYQIPLCQSALSGRFKNDPICLAFTVVGLGPDFIFYQQVSQDPPPKQGVTKWKTRDTDPNPYLDYSGVSTLPVNRWISQPVLVKELPAFLYHSILGQGGKGLDPPFINHFVVTYEYGKCPVD